MWLTIFKIALVVFLVVGIGAVAVTAIRRSRSRGFPAAESSSHFWQIKGAMPPMPKPDQADGSNDDDPGEARQTPTS